MKPRAPRGQTPKTGQASRAPRAANVKTRLFDTEQKLRAILNAAVDAIITIDERGLIESVNPATERLFGYSESELLGKNVSILMPQPYRGEHDGYLRNYHRTGKAKIIGIGREVSGMRKDGKIFPINLSVSEVHLGGRRLFAGVIHDLTERRRLEKQILEASTEEQRRIGQDLHDGLCQELVGIAFAAELLANQLDRVGSNEAKAARQLGAEIRQAAGQARALSHGLNPVDLKAGGLPEALKQLAGKVSQSFGIRCTFRVGGMGEVSDDTVATHFYRIAQEAVGNAIKHGKANRVTIQLLQEGNLTRLVIEDNGTGLAKAVAEKITRGSFPMGAGVHQSAGGIGLQTMRYRARIIGGTFDIQSKPRGGTVVVCSVRRDLPVS